MKDENKKRTPKRIKLKPLEPGDLPDKNPELRPKPGLVDLVFVGLDGSITIKGARLQNGDVLSFPAPDADELLKRYPAHWERKE